MLQPEVNDYGTEQCEAVPHTECVVPMELHGVLLSSKALPFGSNLTAPFAKGSIKFPRSKWYNFFSIGRIVSQGLHKGRWRL